MFYENIKIRRLALIYFLTIFCTIFILAAIESFANVNIGDDLYFCATYPFIIIWFFRCFKKQNNTIKDFTSNFRQNMQWKEVFLIIFFNILLSISSVLILLYFLSKTGSDLFKDILNEPNQIPSGTIFAFFSSVIFAPMVEEIMFRGIVLHRLKIKWGINVSILVSSILFGLLHGFSGFLSATIFGICMSLILIRTNKIIIPITIHFFNNLAAELPSIFSQDTSTVITENSATTVQESIEFLNAYGLAVGLPIFLISFIFFIFYFKKHWPKNNLLQQQL